MHCSSGFIFKLKSLDFEQQIPASTFSEKKVLLLEISGGNFLHFAPYRPRPISCSESLGSVHLLSKDDPHTDFITIILGNSIQLVDIHSLILLFFGQQRHILDFASR